MAEPLGKVVIDIEARLEKLEKVFRDAEDKAKKGGENTGKKFGEGVKKGFNLSGVEVAIAKVFTATAAFEQLGSVLERSLGSVVTAIEEGRDSAGEFVLAFADGLPVIGSFLRVGQDLRSVLTGAATAAQQLAADTERTARILNMQAGDVRRAALREQIEAQLEGITVGAQRKSLILGAGGERERVAELERIFRAEDINNRFDDFAKVLKGATLDSRENLRLLNIARRRELEFNERAQKVGGGGGAALTEQFRTVIGQFRTGTILTPTRQVQEETNRNVRGIFGAVEAIQEQIQEITESIANN